MKLSRRGIVKTSAVCILSAGLAFPGLGVGAPKVGTPAPQFSGITAAGATLELSALRGKTVVLEWTNHDCPYVRKHYESGNMQSLQKHATDEGLVWVSVVSSAPGRQGYVEAAEAQRLSEERGAAPNHIVLDPSGEIGRLYDARTTPHMYVIDPNGTLTYMGGIDDRPTTRTEDIEGATNYVKTALEDMAAGREVATPVARPYGCSIKYGSS